MKGWMIVGIILAVLLLLSLVRVGGILRYSADGLVVQLRLGALRPTLFPLKKKKKKPPKQSVPQKAPPKEPPAKPQPAGGGLELVKRLLPLLAETAGRFQRKVRIDDLDLDLTVAAPDPDATAIAYGGANAFLGMMIPLLEHHFNIKKRKIRTAVDFDQEHPTITIRAAFSLTIGQGAVLSIRLGCQALRILMDHRKQQSMKQKEAVKNGKESSYQ